jgi:hypothetical protein
VGWGTGGVLSLGAKDSSKGSHRWVKQAAWLVFFVWGLQSAPHDPQHRHSYPALLAPRARRQLGGNMTPSITSTHTHPLPCTTPSLAPPTHLPLPSATIRFHQGW